MARNVEYKRTIDFNLQAKAGVSVMYRIMTVLHYQAFTIQLYAVSSLKTLQCSYDEQGAGDFVNMEQMFSL